MFSRLFKPEYLFRPSNIWRRLRAAQPHGRCRVVTARGVPLEVDADDAIGQAIVRFGVYDLLLSETLWRLADAEDRVVDVGANIGYTATLLAQRVARVDAFEALPELAGWCRRNVALQPPEVRERVTVHPLAVADRSGPVRFVRPAAFADNRGTAHIADVAETDGTLTVEAVTLDEVCGGGASVGILKIDVEGAEDRVLAGADRLLRQRRIRDIVYEAEHLDLALERRLEAFGYRVFEPRRALTGPWPATGWQPRNRVATLDPARLRRRFRAPGWQTLRRR